MNSELLSDSEKRLEWVKKRINILSPSNTYTQQVSAYFPLGVGGSGNSKKIHRLNKMKEAEFERAVKNSKELSGLYTEQKKLEKLIADIKCGKYEADLKAKEQSKRTKAERLAEWWDSLVVGASVNIGGNAPVKVVKKSKKSFVTDSGCKWEAYEIIGKEAALLIK